MPPAAAMPAKRAASIPRSGTPIRKLSCPSTFDDPLYHGLCSRRRPSHGRRPTRHQHDGDLPINPLLFSPFWSHAHSPAHPDQCLTCLTRARVTSQRGAGTCSEMCLVLFFLLASPLPLCLSDAATGRSPRDRCTRSSHTVASDFPRH